MSEFRLRRYMIFAALFGRYHRYRCAEAIHFRGVRWACTGVIGSPEIAP